MKKHGFSLIELSIVIVIIGVVLGGVLSGRNLYEQSLIRGYIADMEKYKAAVHNFQGAYDALPGDFSYAETLWSISSTFTGNDNGQIDLGGYSTGNCNSSGEHNGAWHHLSEAGLIEGQYTTIWTSPVAGEQFPIAREQNIYSLGYYSSIGDNAIIIANVRPVAWFRSCSNAGAGLRTSQALLIDEKIDDGVYNTGNVHSANGRFQGESWPTGGNCIDSGDYNLSVDIRNCVLYNKI